MHIIVLDSSLDHLIEIQKSFAFLTFTYTVFPHTLLSLIHTHACTHTKLTHTHTHLRPYVAWTLPGKVIAREKKLWRVSYLFRCHWGAPLFSPSPSLYHFPLSSPLSVSLSLVPTCSLKSCSPPLVFRQSKDKVEICWEQWTVRQCVCVCAWVCERTRGVDVESLKLFSPCPDRSESLPSPFNPLMLHHTHSHTNKTHFSGCSGHS